MFNYETKDAFGDRLLGYERMNENTFICWYKVTLKGHDLPTYEQVNHFGFSKNYFGGRIDGATKMKGNTIEVLLALYKD
jgi:hypothetical protein